MSPPPAPSSSGDLTSQLAAVGIASAAVVGIHSRKKIQKAVSSSMKSSATASNDIEKARVEEDEQARRHSAAGDAEGRPHPYTERHPQGFGKLIEMNNIHIDSVYLLPVPNINEWLPLENAYYANDTCKSKKNATAEDNDGCKAPSSSPKDKFAAYNKLMSDEDVILGDIRRNPKQAPTSRAYLRAGPRPVLYFEPSEVKAAIVTCGGLCPGLNNVIRDTARSLWNLYGVRTIYGIRNGWNGFHDWNTLSDKTAPLMLTPQTTSGIHHLGGTILGSNRGGFDVDKILDFLVRYDVSQLYVIGGDGTHRGANKIADKARLNGLKIAVAGIPKTIDNDVDLLDRSFGFNTAVEEAQRAIRSAKTESRCVPNGIGVVKLMGRSAGFIAAHASLSSGDVDLCLIPEVPIVLDGPQSCLSHIERVIEQRGSAVVVVAEGAGEELLGQSTEKDAGGNKKLQPIGEFMKDRFVEHFKTLGKVATVKYIDPSYMIRSVAANAADSLYCMLLSQNAVHGVMAGYTSFTVGLSGNRVVYLPIEAVTKNSPRCVDPVGRTWERVLCLTGQPNTYVEKDTFVGARSSSPPI